MYTLIALHAEQTSKPGLTPLLPAPPVLAPTVPPSVVTNVARAIPSIASSPLAQQALGNLANITSNHSNSAQNHAQVVGAGLKAAHVVLKAAHHVPLVGIVAVLLSELILLCDQYRCNQLAFQSLKMRMQGVQTLYFAPGGRLNFPKFQNKFDW